MEVKLGIKDSNRELVFDSASSPADVYSSIEAALTAGASLIKFTDTKGRLIALPASALAYVEIGAEESRRVGFIS